MISAVTLLCSTFQKKTAKEHAEDERKKRQQYRELISDLDWWSKYYATKDDAAKV